MLTEKYFKQKIAFFAVLLLSIYTLLRTIYNAKGEYIPIVILPLFYILFLLILLPRVKYLFKSIVFTILWGGYFIKMVLTPLLYSYAEYKSFYYVSIETNDILYASLLIGVESVVTALVLFVMIKKHPINIETQTITVDKENNIFVNFIILALILFLIVSYRIVPQLKIANPLFYKATLNDAALLRIDNENIVARGTFQRYLYSLFNFFLPIFRNIVPLYFLSKIKNIEKSKFLVFILLFVPFIFLNSSNAQPIHCSILVLLVLNRLYNKKVKTVNIIVFIVGLIVLFIIITAKMQSLLAWRGIGGIAAIAQFVNAYFPGVDNAAIVHQIGHESYFTTLFYDLYYVIPFQNTLFGLKGDNLQDVFTAISMTGSQVIPWCSQISHYTGFIFAPLVTMAFIIKAIKSEINGIREKEYWSVIWCLYYSYFTSVAICTYSFSIYLSGLVNVGIPILIISNISKKLKLERGEYSKL